jgi:hypothetical protein
MAYSYNLFTGDGSTKLFAITFGYLEQSHVKVAVGGVDTAYTWSNASTVELATAPSDGAVVKVYRDSPKTSRVVDFQNGGLTEEDLDNSALQQFYISQEALDKSSDVLHKDDAGNFYAEDKRIVSVAYPEADSDAVNRAFVTDTVSATISSLYLTPESFGAIGDDVTDDTAALNSAVASAYASGKILLMNGKYKTLSTITSLHDIEKTGGGYINVSGALFYITPRVVDTNTIYVDPVSGSNTNDGLRTTRAVKTIQRAIDIWNKYARTTKGNWTIKLAAGTYTEGGVVDGVVSPTELVIEGTLSGGVPATIIDGTGAVNTNGLNLNNAGRVRVKYIQVQDFPSNGITFSNGTVGVIDTCNANNCPYGFRANQNVDLRIIGNCTIEVPAGGTGIIYYRQSNGSWSDTAGTLTINAAGKPSVGIYIRDNSYVVSDYGAIDIDGFGEGILVSRHSYIEVRYGSVSNCDIGIRIHRTSLFADSLDPMVFSGNTQNYHFADFSSAFDTNDTEYSVVTGQDGPSGKALGTTYQLVVDNDQQQTGLQFLTNSTLPILIDFNNLGSIRYVQSDNSLRYYLNAIDTYRMRTDAILPTTDNVKTLGVSAFRWLSGYFTELRPGTGTAKWTSGEGSPEGVLVATIGSLYTRIDGGANTTLYVKESGTGNTGWVAK